MSDIYKKETYNISKFYIAISFLVGFVVLSACKSTVKKDDKVVSTPTNQTEKTQKKTQAKQLVHKEEKKVVEIKAPERKTTNVKKTTNKTAKTVTPTSKKLVAKNTIKKAINKTEIPKEADIEKTIPVESIIDVDQSLPTPLLTSLEQIPLELSNGWLLTIKELPMANSKSCTLYNEQNGLFDGYRDNNIKVYLTLTNLVIMSESNFDLTYPETGVYIEDNGASPLVNSLTLTTQPNIALSELPLKNYHAGTAQNLIIQSGFWPSWPITETKKMTFSIADIDEMLLSLETCSSLLKSL